MSTSQEPVFFENTAALRRWFAKNAATATELAVGYMRKGTGVASITWPEAVDEALCVGWIDGVRHRIDDARYRIRFTLRRRDSHWSNFNIRRVAELKKLGRMKAAGLAAWKYYGAVPPGYRQLVTFWITSARKAETRAKRLRTLIEACAKGRRLS